MKILKKERLINMVQKNLYIYHPNGKRATVPDDFPIHFFGSSSRGNATYIPELSILIDFGMAYHYYTDYDKDFFYNLKYVFLTHQHGDHLNPSVMHRVLKLYPHIQFVMSPYVHQFLNSADLKWNIDDYQDRFIELPIKELDPTSNLPIYHTFKIKLPDGLTFTVTPVATRHEKIINTAYYVYWETIEQMTNDMVICHEHRLMYASDLDSIKQLLPLKGDHRLDYCLLEANHDSVAVQESINKADSHCFEASGCLRHLSEQEAWDYITPNVKSTGYFLPLHASKTFSTLVQNLDEEKE